MTIISDDSGYWGSGGLFTAISAKSTLPEDQYSLAGEMRGNYNINKTY